MSGVALATELEGLIKIIIKKLDKIQEQRSRTTKFAPQTTFLGCSQSINQNGTAPLGLWKVCKDFAVICVTNLPFNNLTLIT